MAIKAPGQDANGYLHILDRLKDMIVTGGENVYSGEVDAEIGAGTFRPMP
jgi:acyl-CoA synthetase (AMP-forming)/AMP-acid ligase II